LFPHLFGIGLFGWHGSVQKKNWFLASAQNEDKDPHATTARGAPAVKTPTRT
jgi:hypothetical protein